MNKCGAAFPITNAEHGYVQDTGISLGTYIVTAIMQGLVANSGPFVTENPEALAKRACDIAGALMSEISNRGWH